METRHIDIISHSLGVDLYHSEHSEMKKDKHLPDEFYRNYWCAGKPEGDYPDHDLLLNEGFLETWVQYSNRYYCVTKKGIEWFRGYFKENITDKFKPPSRGRQKYLDYLHSECGDSFDEYLGIQLPTLETCSDSYTFTSDRRTQIPYGWHRYVSVKYSDVKGEWMASLKEAKKSYKNNLKEYLKTI